MINKNCYFFKFAIFILAFATISVVATTNVAAQYIPGLLYGYTYNSLYTVGLNPFIPQRPGFNSALAGFNPLLGGSPLFRSASLVTGGGGGASVEGIWRGTWLSLVKFDGGLLDLVLIQDPITGLLNGTVALILNKLIPIPIEVTGSSVIGSSVVELTGFYLDIVSGTLYTLTMTCTIPAPGIMDGTYSIISLKNTDFGTFNASLVL